MDGSQKADEIAFNCYTKLFYVVNEARITGTAEGNLMGIDKWFDIETQKAEIPPYTYLFKSISLSPISGPPPFEIQVLLSRTDLPPNQALVYVLADESRVYIEPKFTSILLESWKLNFVPRDDEILDISPPTMYKHGIPLFRSLFSYLRILPAWNLCKRLSKRTRNPHDGELRIKIRVRSSLDADDDPEIMYFHTPHISIPTLLSTNAETFPSIPHPIGSLSVSVTYLTIANFEVDEFEVYFSSNRNTPMVPPRSLPIGKGSPIARFPPTAISTNHSKRLSSRGSYSPGLKSIRLLSSNTNLPNTLPSFGFVAPGPRKKSSDSSFSYPAQHVFGPSPLLNSFPLFSLPSSSTPTVAQSSSDDLTRHRALFTLSDSPSPPSAIQIPSRRPTIVPDDPFRSTAGRNIVDDQHQIDKMFDSSSLATVTSSSMMWVFREGRYAPVQPDNMDLGADHAGRKKLVIYSAVEIERLCAIFKDILAHKNEYRTLLNYQGNTMQRIIDVIQMLLDDSRVEATFRARMLRLLLRLSRSSILYPRCFTLKSVNRGASALTAGQFGEIWKGECRGQIVCLKVVKIYERSHVQKLSKAFSKEAIVWGQISHPNLLPFYGIHHLDDVHGRISLVSPWMENGNIREYLLHNEEAPRLYLIQDIISGISHLHHGGIIHGDLKGANILITKSGRACVADFGLSYVVEGDVSWSTAMNSSVHIGGTVRWQAPELFDAEDDNLSATKASDIYAFSCVCYEVFTGRVPFYEIPREPTVIYKIMQGEHPPRPSPENLLYSDWGLTDDTWVLMEDCWRKDPSFRPNAQGALNRISLELTTPDQRPSRESDFLHPSQFRNAVMDDDTGGMERGGVQEIEALVRDFLL